MSKYDFEISFSALMNSDSFAEATADELRILLALVAAGGKGNDEELARSAGVSKARLVSGIALWAESSVLKQRAEYGEYENSVTEEFEERLYPGALYEQTQKEIAEGIRNNKLADLISECATLMGKATLSPMEVNRITALTVQYMLSEEYIAVLAAYLAEHEKLSVTRLVNDAIKNCEKGVDTVEALEVYIAESERNSGIVREFSDVVGIRGRNPSNAEIDLFLKWNRSFGFGKLIVAQAYSYSTSNTDKRAIKYMDTLLTDWFENGCKTVEDCDRRYAERRAELEAQRNAKGENGAKGRKKKPTHRFGDFDPEEALRLALERSFDLDD